MTLFADILTKVTLPIIALVALGYLLQPRLKLDVPPIAEPMRRLIDWVADYYLAPPAAVLRMALSVSSALGGDRSVVEYRLTGIVPGRATPPGGRAGGAGAGAARRRRDVLRRRPAQRALAAPVSRVGPPQET